MQYLVFRLYGPAASWGNDQAGEERRPTNRHPGRSALLGLLAAGLGITRSDQQSHSELDASVLFAVCSHGPRHIARDFRTTQTVEPGKGKRQIRFRTRREALQHDKVHTLMSWRDYVTDGLWRVGVAHRGGPISLEAIAAALHKPVFHLYLGRREFAPALPLNPKLIEAENLGAALDKYPAVPEFDSAKYPVLASATQFLARHLCGPEDRVHWTWDADFPGAPSPQHQRHVRTQPVSRTLWCFDLNSEYGMWIEGEVS